MYDEDYPWLQNEKSIQLRFSIDFLEPMEPKRMALARDDRGVLVLSSIKLARSVLSLSLCHRFALLGIELVMRHMLVGRV